MQPNEYASRFLSGDSVPVPRINMRKIKDVLRLKLDAKLSHQQIADILGSSVGATKANFFHALANLKKLLGNAP